MSLIQKAKSQPEAFVELYDRYAERIYQYLQRRLHHAPDAEDLSGQVWEKALSKIHTLESDAEEGFLAWLFAIARNELNQHYRSGEKRFSQELPETLADKARGPDCLAEDSLGSQAIREALFRLPPQQRETVELRYFGDLRNKEIALLFGISEKTVASNLSRALQTLSLHLEKLQ